MMPGTWLLKIAPLVFNERFIEIVVRPTIADLQSEVAAAGSNHAKRFRVRCRGYAAFWTLMFVAPFASWSEERANVASGLAAGSVVVTLLTVVTLGPWTALVAAGATLVALLLHGWYERHPSEIARAARRVALAANQLFDDRYRRQHRRAHFRGRQRADRVAGAAVDLLVPAGWRHRRMFRRLGSRRVAHAGTAGGLDMRRTTTAPAAVSVLIGRRG